MVWVCLSPSQKDSEIPLGVGYKKFIVVMVAIIVMWEFICGCSCIPKTSYLLYLSNWCLLLCPVRLSLASRDDAKDSANTWSARKDCRVWLPCCSGSFSWGGKTPSMELLWNFWHIQDWFKTWAFLILSMLQKPGKWLDVYFLGVVGLSVHCSVILHTYLHP